jgi:acetyl-CoA acyltransferase 1
VLRASREKRMAAIRTAARKLTQKSPNDVVVLAAVRSPVTRAFKGGLRDAYPEDILGPVSIQPQLSE